MFLLSGVQVYCAVDANFRSGKLSKLPIRVQRAYRVILEERPPTVRDAIKLLVVQEGIPDHEAAQIVEFLWDAGIMLAIEPEDQGQCGFPSSLSSYWKDSTPYVLEFWVVHVLNLIALLVTLSIRAGSTFSVVRVFFTLLQTLILMGWCLTSLILPDFNKPLSLNERLCLSLPIGLGVCLLIGVIADEFSSFSEQTIAWMSFATLALLVTLAAVRRILAGKTEVEGITPPANTNPELVSKET